MKIISPTFRKPVLRLSLYFGALFSVVGIQVPYWPIFLETRGLSPTQIGIVLSAALWVKVVLNPFIAQWADLHGERRRPMFCLCVLSILAYSGFFYVQGFWAILLVSVLAGVTFGAIMPLGENVALTWTYKNGIDYGRVRLWGSVTFIGSTLLIPILLGSFEESIILWVLLFFLTATLFGCFVLPEFKAEKPKPNTLPLGQLFRHSNFVLFLLAASLSQASHAVLYGFGTIHWRKIGIPDGIIGLLWAEGVLAEIIFFLAGAGLVVRFGVIGLLGIGSVAGIIRWFVYSISNDLSIIVLMQLLHAFTFGATHLGAMHFIARAVPPSWSVSAQSLYTTVSGGITLGVAIWAAGSLYEDYAEGAYVFASIMSGLSLLLVILLSRCWNGRCFEVDKG